MFHRKLQEIWDRGPSAHSVTYFSPPISGRATSPPPNGGFGVNLSDFQALLTITLLFKEKPVLSAGWRRRPTALQRESRRAPRGAHSGGSCEQFENHWIELFLKGPLKF